MPRLKFIWDKEEEKEEEKPGWLQRTRGIGELPELPASTKLKFTADVGLGIGAKATGGITLPEYKPLIEGLPMSKPEDKFPGFEMVEDTKLSAYTPQEKTLWNKVGDLLKGIPKIGGETPEAINARAQVSLNISQQTGIPATTVNQNLDKITKELGIRGIPTTGEFVSEVIKWPIIYAIVTNPVYTTIRIGEFLALTEGINKVGSLMGKWEYKFGAGKGVKDLLPEETNQFTKDVVGVAEFLGKAYLIGKFNKSVASLKLWDKFTKDLTSEYHLPQRVVISAKDAKLVTIDEFSKMGIKGEQVLSAREQGIDIEVPLTEVVKFADKPWWSSVKGFFGIKPYSEITTMFPTDIATAKPHAFGSLGEPATVLYGGLPVDKIAGEIMKYGKVSAEWVKGLTPDQIALIAKQLTPALASEFLKAVEKPEAISKVGAEIPKELQPLAEEARKYEISKEDIIAEKDELMRIDEENRKSGFVKGTPISEEVALKQAINGLIEDKKSEIKITKTTDILTKERQNEVRKSTSFEDTFSKSKVPEVVYHGSQSEKIIKFEKRESSGIGIGAVAKAEGEAGFWFTSNKNEAKTIGNVIQAKLNMKNPLILEGDIYFNTQGTARLDAISEMEGEGKDSIIFIEPTTKQKWYFVPNKEQIVSQDFYAQATAGKAGAAIPVTEQPAVVAPVAEKAISEAGKEKAIYHVTTGVKGIGLGSLDPKGETRTVSFTTDINIAKNIQDTLILKTKIAKGDIGYQELRNIIEGKYPDGIGLFDEAFQQLESYYKDDLYKNPKYILEGLQRFEVFYENKNPDFTQVWVISPDKLKAIDIKNIKIKEATSKEGAIPWGEGKRVEGYEKEALGEPRLKEIRYLPEDITWKTPVAEKATAEVSEIEEPTPEEISKAFPIVKPTAKPAPERTYIMNKDLTQPQRTEGNKLIGQIHKIANDKGLTGVEFTALKRKYGLSPHLATATKRMTIPQLEAVLQAVQKARPKIVNYKHVITPKTERKIQSLKDNLIDKLQMTEEAYTAILKSEGVYKEPKYTDASNFITEKQGKDIIYRLIDEANILKITMPYDKAVTENEAIKSEVNKIDKRIRSVADRRLKDPHELNSMRLYIQKMETITGTPIYPLYQDLINSHLENKNKLGQFIKEFEPYKEIITDEKELKKVNDYILAKSNLKDKPEVPANITPKEIKLAKKIEDILTGYEAKARTEKFLDSIDHPEDMPQYQEFKKEIDKAKDIYESKGYDDLVEYMKDQKWGVIRSGYSPLQVLTPKIRIFKPKAQTFGKSHIKTRTDIEYHEQDRNLIQRLFSYKKQMDNLVVMRPKVRALITQIEKNLDKFKDPSRISSVMEVFFRELKGYNKPENWFDRGLNRLYAQAMQTIIMPSPVLSGRNLLQNAAFGHDKTNLIDPRNKPLTKDDVDYIKTYSVQTDFMKVDWFMVGEKSLPGMATLTKMVQKIGIYPYSDTANRYWGFWAKINQVRRAFASDKSLDKKMAGAKFSDMELTEQKMALQILAKDGEEAMARYVARVYVDNTQFLYDRSQRSPAEMGRVGRWAGNLMLFPRAYWEMLLKQSKKFSGKYVPFKERARAFKVIASVIGGGILVGAAYKKVTGRQENPYDPLTLLAYEPGGLAIGTVQAVTDVYVNILMASKGDSRALAALTTAIPQAADMFIPFYAYAIRALEASTDTKNIDRLALRKLRMMIDKEYEVRGDAYVLEREAMEKWQYFLSGAGIDVVIKEREAGIAKEPLKITIPKSGKLTFTKPKLNIKSTKLKFTF